MTRKSETCDKILACVADGYSHSVFIADKTGIPRATVTHYLSELAKEGKLVRRCRGVYEYPAGARKPSKKAFSIVDWVKTPLSWIK